MIYAQNRHDSSNQYSNGKVNTGSVAKRTDVDTDNVMMIDLFVKRDRKQVIGTGNDIIIK